MTVVLTEGCDTYNGIGANTGLGSKWVNLATVRLALAAGRFGGQCVNIFAQNNAIINGQTYRTLPNNYSSIGVGLAFRASGFVALANAPLSNMFAALTDSAGVFQVGLALNPVDGSLNAYRLTGANAGTLLGSSAAGVILDTTWHFIEWAVAIDDAAGTVVVKVDGITVINLSAQDTRNGTPTTVNRLYLSGGLSAASSVPTFNFDDIYVTNGATIGERRVQTLYPSADTASKAFVPSTGTNNYACVDEAIVSTADYVQGSAVGDLDLYELTDISGSPSSIDAVNIIAYAEKTDASTRAFALVADIAGTQTQSADFSLAASYNKNAMLLTAKPGGGAWDLAAVNALRVGPKVTV